ncbi:unnamed protein product [Larinioides sclopetarius]|uniref:Uncharacterized protein n=1 Tax=Larinioides sclopetarius TaxID=280406 RepID=A0AAV2BUW8_9ARAC
MSASGSSESPELKTGNFSENSRCTESKYTLYLFSNNKHATSSDTTLSDKESRSSAKSDSKASNNEEPSVCLSLFEGNLSAEQETVVRCYLLKTLSARQDLSFENDGKYAELQFSSEESGKMFGCYYHRLSKHSSAETEPNEENGFPKLHTFFICLIGPANGVMESFCPELGKFCYILIPLLDPEGLKNKDNVQLKLKSWYFHCVEYVRRCIENFGEDLVTLLHCSLWGNVEVTSEDEQAKWDTERFVETCCVMPATIENSKDTVKDNANLSFIVTIKDGKIEVDKLLDNSPYCSKWLDKLKSCPSTDHIGQHNILEGFRLKVRPNREEQKKFWSIYRMWLNLCCN